MHAAFSFLDKLVLEPGIWGALGLLAVSAFDELVAFVPSSLILAAELLFVRNPITLIGLSKLTLYVGLPIALGTMVGSMPLFWAGYAGGKPALEAAGKRWKFKWAEVERFEKRFKGRWEDDLLFLFFRATPLMPTLPVTVAAGVLRMNALKYTLLTVLGIMIRVVITLVILRTGGEAVLTHAFHL